MTDFDRGMWKVWLCVAVPWALVSALALSTGHLEPLIGGGFALTVFALMLLFT